MKHFYCVVTRRCNDSVSSCSRKRGSGVGVLRQIRLPLSAFAAVWTVIAAVLFCCPRGEEGCWRAAEEAAAAAVQGEQRQ